ncbi:YheC/YheD family endospore coat-associated protein [Brevibacillus daliensis]|uniref:YheC/YheD family endospore coat-associated protein n=1 Tax=Brevibacillus daliensis TaxID=2892995 RepID=UPI001E492CC9|nr:YheC/YheD family protein [Brevibacillus daliensis]
MESLAVRLSFLTYLRVKAIVLPSHLCREWGLKHKMIITISHGQKNSRALVMEDTQIQSGRVVKLTSPLKKALAIPYAGTIHIKNENGTLRIGPSIGIVTTGIKTDTQTLLGGRTRFFKKLLMAQKGKGVYYFLFSPDEVDWESNQVNGWFLLPNEQGEYSWRQCVTAMPDSLYDRIPSRAAEAKDDVQDFKIKLITETHVPIFNLGFFDKWGVHQRLSYMPEVTNYIPETHLAPTLDMLESMLEKYPMLYLKPKNGSLGYGIVKVQRLSNGFRVSYRMGGSNFSKTFAKLANLYRHIFRTRQVSNYLIQQGIQLCTYKGRPFDFRVHLHKNLDNNWVVSCMAAKVAGVGSVTTHVRTGGFVIPGRELLETLFPDRFDELEEQIREASVRLAQSMELAYSTHLGELGLDMAIDLNGDIWMFEANSKPGRSIFKHDRLKRADELSRSLLVDYSRYLANF